MLYLARKGSAEAAPAFRQASNLSAGHPMKKVLMYSTRICPYCQAAERLLKSRGVERIEKILVDENTALREQMLQRTGLKTVPQIFIGDMYVGGYDTVAQLDRTGEMETVPEQQYPEHQQRRAPISLSVQTEAT